MTDQRITAAGVASLRAAFDTSFAAAPAVDETPYVDLLAIRAGAGSYVVDVADIAGVFAGKAVTAVPSAVPALLGVTSNRGIVFPVYDLCALLGSAGTRTTPRWLVVTGGTPVGLAFDRLEGRLRVPPEELARRSVLQVSAVLNAIRRLAHQDAGPRSSE